MSAKDDERRVNEYVRSYNGVRGLAVVLVEFENAYSRETARLKKRIRDLEAKLKAATNALDEERHDPDHRNG